ncbi:MAG: RNA-binding domain-containing protein [Akkermansia sp.]
MLEEELLTLIETIQRRGYEGQTTEVKAAAKGCPEKLYDTMSSFSNQDDGGVFVFGLDETQHFEAVGVYNAQDLQKRVMEQGEQMTPIVRPIFTVCDRDGKVFVSAEITPVDLAERPCYKTAKGRLKGSYKRVGDADKPMTEYHIYCYEAYRKHYREDAQEAGGATLDFLAREEIDYYLACMRGRRPNLSAIGEAQQLELCGITNKGRITLSALLLFGVYPQALYPRLCIAAARIPGEDKGETDDQGNRFLDSESIIGTLPDMLERALDFVRRNMCVAIGIDPNTGQRKETPDYPPIAVREVILNALMHRDYSRYNEDKPIRLEMYDDRLEIIIDLAINYYCGIIAA